MIRIVTPETVATDPRLEELIPLAKVVAAELEAAGIQDLTISVGFRTGEHPVAIGRNESPGMYVVALVLADHRDRWSLTVGEPLPARLIAKIKDLVAKK